MSMSSSDLFLLRQGLVDAGIKQDVAEKIATAMEGAMALTLDQVLEKWSTKVEHDMQKLSFKVEHDIAALRTELKHDIEVTRKDIEVTKRDMTIRLGLMLAGFAGLILSGMKLYF